MKRFFDLQMFAEEATEEVTAEVTEEATGEDEQEQTEKVYTQSELEKIIKDRLKRERKKENADVEAVNEAEKFKNLTQDQKVNRRVELLEQQLAELENKDYKNAMGVEVRKRLSDEGIPVKEAIVASLIRDNAEDTKEVVDEFVVLMDDMKKEIEKKHFSGKTPKVNTTSTTSTTKSTEKEWTKEEILKVKDTVKRHALIKENRDLFK